MDWDCCCHCLATLPDITGVEGADQPTKMLSCGRLENVLHGPVHCSATIFALGWWWCYDLCCIFCTDAPSNCGELAAGSAYLRCFGHTYWLRACAEWAAWTRLVTSGLLQQEFVPGQVQLQHLWPRAPCHYQWRKKSTIIEGFTLQSDLKSLIPSLLREKTGDSTRHQWALTGWH